MFYVPFTGCQLSRMRTIILFLIFFGFTTILRSQFSELQIKVYDFDDGISHRNVFKILQDDDGFIWAATINGLSRFDGYKFLNFNSTDAQKYIPHDVISDMTITPNNYIWLGNPDYLTGFDPSSFEVKAIKIKQGEYVRRQSLIPHSLFVDDRAKLWMATYDEKSAETSLQVLNNTRHSTISNFSGTYTKRPIIQLGEYLYIGSYEGELLKLNQNQDSIDKIDLIDRFELGTKGRIVQMQAFENQLWILFSDGELYHYDPKTEKLILHPISQTTASTGVMSSFLVLENGDVWMGGRGVLWYFNSLSGVAENYDPPINQIIKNTCYYRQIFEDHSGIIWLATDFGLIKVDQAKHLFMNYLNGGSEYCSNVFCSTRGMTEDDAGNIYISYYNSIHILNPENNTLRLLFPENDYFNYPFGLIHHDNHLYTGNGRRISLSNLQVDTLFERPNLDLGAVMKDKDDLLWFGYLSELFLYDPISDQLNLYEDTQGRWDSTGGTISHLYQGRISNKIWISTLENGVFKIDKERGREDHYHAGKNSPIRLYHNQINAVHESDNGILWLATGKGIHRIDLATESLKVFTKASHGLPHDFINGFLPEGDSCLWVSTNNGLARFNIHTHAVNNFFVSDGLTSNEFNRISFYKARDGRMYLGGLNGINAFYPGERFIKQKVEEHATHPFFTSFSYFDSAKDTTHLRETIIEHNEEITLSHNVKVFSIHFGLSNFQQPLENEFSFKLEGYEDDWTIPSTVNSVRYNNIPAGNYTFRLRARSAGDQWNEEELQLSIHIKEAFYRTWWFLSLCFAMLIGGIWGTARYRIYLLQRREKQLEELVNKRTEELAKEKEKSENLLLNILPAEIAEELKANGVAKAKRHELVTVMFSDFKGFTRISEQMEPEALVAEIDLCFRAFDRIIDKHNLEKIKTVGDAYLCVSSIADCQEDDAVRVIRAALEIQTFMQKTAAEKQAANLPHFEARIGVHTGPLVAGIVGIKKFAYDIWGDTVNIASRMETNSEVGEVNVSEMTYQLIKESYDCRFHGIYSEIERRPINMYFVEKNK